MVMGVCNCGIVFFEIDVEFCDIIVCYCFICCWYVGGNGMLVVVVVNFVF